MVTVAVIGAGVVGLSTAIKAQDAGHSVTIIAEYVPGDPFTIHYTSPWAGAHHVGDLRDDELQQRMNQETLHTMLRMAEGDARGCFLKHEHSEYGTDEPGDMKSLAVMPNFRLISPSDLPLHAKYGFAFSTVSIDPPTYLPYLLQLFLSRGGRLLRSRVQHITQVMGGAYSGTAASGPDAIFVCAGIGARALGGVEDRDVYPIRGQTVLVRAPWIQFGRRFVSHGQKTYIIPRRNGDVILGGCTEADDWFPHPRPEMAKSILERTLALCPELIPPQTRDQHVADPGHIFSIADLEPIIIEHGCGLRPARKGGVRLEREVVEGEKGTTVIIYNYGHGGGGYQSSWGSASIAMGLLTGALQS